MQKHEVHLASGPIVFFAAKYLILHAKNNKSTWQVYLLFVSPQNTLFCMTKTISPLAKWTYCFCRPKIPDFAWQKQEVHLASGLIVFVAPKYLILHDKNNKSTWQVYFLEISPLNN